MCEKSKNQFFIDEIYFIYQYLPHLVSDMNRLDVMKSFYVIGFIETIMDLLNTTLNYFFC